MLLFRSDAKWEGSICLELIVLASGRSSLI